MITFLTTFKPFVGDDGLRQRNALLSWRALDEDVEVMVFGHSEGLAPLVRSLGLIHYPDVPCIDGRLPRVDAMFEIAQERGKHELQAYVNGDIVLGPDFVEALGAIHLARFLMVGQRWNTDVLPRLTEADPQEMARFRDQALRQGWLHPPHGIDYFAYRRGTLAEVPPLAPGAILWDNFMIEHCRRKGIAVIDATRQVLAIHQSHDYRLARSGETATVDSPASEHNRKLVGSQRSPHCVLDASLLLTPRGLRPGWTSLAHLRHKVLALPVRDPRWRWLAPAFAGISKTLGVLERGSQLYHIARQRRQRRNTSL